MYIIHSDVRRAYRTTYGWTTIHKGTLLVGLEDVLRFTKNEAELNKDTLPKGNRFVYFPERKWRYLDED